MSRISIKSIGFVRTGLTEDDLRKRQYDSKLIIYRDYEGALEGIEDFSHLNVIFWMHDIPASERRELKARPRGCRDMPLVGVLATRAPHRPNPIGLSLVELVERRGNILKVRGLDALDGSPVLDLKPYDKWDRAEHVRVPEWWTKLERERKCRR